MVDEFEQLKTQLREAGVPGVDGFGCFTSTKYENVFGPQPHLDEAAAFPLLLEALPNLTQATAVEAVARHLTDRRVRGAAVQPLAEAFRTWAPRDRDTAWAIGNALGTVARPSDLDDLLDLAQDVRFGMARQMIVDSLWRYRKDDRVPSVLLRLASDPDVCLHAMGAYRRTVGNETAIRDLTMLAQASTNDVVRRQAAKTCRRAEKAIAKNG